MGQQGNRVITRAEYRVMVKKYKKRQQGTVVYKRKQLKKLIYGFLIVLIECVLCQALDDYLWTVDMKTFMQEVPEDPFTNVRGAYVEVHQGVQLGWTPEMFFSGINLTDTMLVMFDHVVPSALELGEYQVPLYFVDSYGHSREVSGTLAVRRSSRIPEISGVTDLFIFPGDSVSYLKNVTATDAFGDKMTVTVDNSQVNINKYGIYDVVYQAKDVEGYVSRETCLLEVVDDRDEVQRFVEDTIDEIFERILHSEMTQRQQAYAIFEWCRTNVRYASSGPRGDDYSIAYASLRGGAGDCYSYFAVSYLMLQRAEIPVIPMQRVEGTVSTHKWVAVNVGEGWYHFDPCRTWTGDRVFLYSDAQAKRVTTNSDKLAGYSTKYYVYRDIPDGITIS